MERLDRRDLRLILVCLVVMAAGGAVTALLFRRAFPEASIEFRVNREQARSAAEKFLAARGVRLAGTRFAGAFDVQEEPKVYLERELGLERAGAFYGTDAKVWLWQMRWFRSGVKSEERVAITPRGDLASFESIRPEDAPGPRLSQDAARAVSSAFLAARGLGGLTPIEAVPLSLPRRTDWTFVDERPGFRMGEATVRYATTVSGGDLTAYREFVHVPEAWTRDYQKLRSKNVTANVVGNFALFVTFFAMAAVLVTKMVRRDVPWGLVGAIGATGFLLSLLSTLNGLPQTLMSYDTASPLSAFLTSRLVLGVLLAIGVGAFLAFVVAAAEPVYRERFPGDLALSRIFSARGIRTKRFFLGLLVGYALVARTVRARPRHEDRPHPREMLALLRDRRLWALFVPAALHWAACAPYHVFFGVLVRDLHLPDDVTSAGMATGVVAVKLTAPPMPTLPLAGVCAIVGAVGMRSALADFRPEPTAAKTTKAARMAMSQAILFPPTV
jgi:hypothetical protein